MQIDLATVSLSRFKSQLGTKEDREIFTAALTEDAELAQLSRDALYPAKLPAVRLRLRELGVTVNPDLEDLVYGQLKESARPELAAVIGRARQPRFLAKVLPAIAALDRKLFLLLETEAIATEKTERKLYAPWGIEFSTPPLTAAIRAILATNKAADAERGPSRHFNFTGEDLGAILSGWFTEPLT